MHSCNYSWLRKCTKDLSGEYVKGEGTLILKAIENLNQPSIYCFLAFLAFDKGPTASYEKPIINLLIATGMYCIFSSVLIIPPVPALVADSNARSIVRHVKACHAVEHNLGDMIVIYNVTPLMGNCRTFLITMKVTQKANGSEWETKNESRQSYPQDKNLHLIWTIQWHLNLTLLRWLWMSLIKSRLH